GCGWGVEMSGLSDLQNRAPLIVVEERDVDMLLVMELYASESFQQFIARRVANLDDGKFVGAWRRIHTQLGEADLLVLFDHSKRGRVAVMIEDKIDAPPQPRQVERYHQRGKQGIADGSWHQYFACLCSPQKYLPEESKGEWHCLLRFEEIILHLDQRMNRDA